MRVGRRGRVFLRQHIPVPLLLSNIKRYFFKGGSRRNMPVMTWHLSGRQKTIDSCALLNVLKDCPCSTLQVDWGDKGSTEAGARLAKAKVG